MNPESFAKKYVKKAEEDELVMLARIRNPRDWKKYVENYGGDYLLALIISDEDKRERRKDQLMKTIQKHAIAEVNRRKVAELKADQKQRKLNRQALLTKYGELRKEGRIVVWSRRKAQNVFQDDGSFNHHCPGWYTDSNEQTRRCEEIHKISLIKEEPLQPVFQPFLTTVFDKKSSRAVLAEPKLGPRVGTGNLAPILSGIINGNEEWIVMRCGRCNTTDDLKITLKKE